MITIDIALDDILPSPFNPRLKFTGLDELATSITEKIDLAKLKAEVVADKAKKSAKGKK